MVITVACPSCAASFPVDSNKIPAAGVNARCSSCRHVFRIERPVEPPPPPAPPEPLPTFEPIPEPEPTSPPVELPEREPPAAEPKAPPAAGVGVGAERDWIFERDEGIDPGSLDIKPMEAAEPAPFAPPIVEAAPPPPPPAPEAAPVGGFTFGKRDPKDKARRLARVLVSDMIMYNPDRHERAFANGTLKEDFEDEIAKSWREYVEQVGEEMATENPFWTDALNDVLAKGQKIF